MDFEIKPLAYIKSYIQKILFCCFGLCLQLALEAQTDRALFLSAPVDSFIYLENNAYLFTDTNRILPWESANETFKKGEYLPFNTFSWDSKYEKGRYAYWLGLEINTDSSFVAQDVIFNWFGKDSLDFYLLENDILQQHFYAGNLQKNQALK